MEFIKITSFILSLALIFTGLIPILATFGIVIDISFIPTILISIIIIIAAIFLLIDAFREIHSYAMLFFISLILALSVLTLYVIPLLSNFGITLFVIPMFIINILYIINLAAGLFLLIGSFVD